MVGTYACYRQDGTIFKCPNSVDYHWCQVLLLQIQIAQKTVVTNTLGQGIGTPTESPEQQNPMGYYWRMLSRKVTLCKYQSKSLTKLVKRLNFHNTMLVLPGLQG